MSTSETRHDDDEFDELGDVPQKKPRLSSDTDDENNDHGKDSENDNVIVNSRNCLEEHKILSVEDKNFLIQSEFGGAKKPDIKKKQLKPYQGGACPATTSRKSSRSSITSDSSIQIQEQIDNPIVEALHEGTIDQNVQSQHPETSED